MRQIPPAVTCTVLLALLLAPVALPHAAELRGGQITVVHEPSDAAVARLSLRIAGETLQELAHPLPAGDQPITIVICRTYGEFREYAGTLARPGVTGVAESSSGVLAVKSPVIQPSGADFEGTLRHELIHVLLARSYNVHALPRWLNEGITMTLSGENRLADRFTAGYMYVRGNLIRYPDLAIALEAVEYDGRLAEAYAQSLSMTEFLMKRLGKERFWQLIRELDHSDFPAALEKVGGMTIPSFMDAWQASLWKIALVFSIVSGFSAFQLMILLTFLAYWRIRRRNKARMARWQQEEEEEVPYLFAHELEGQEEPYPWEEEDEDRL